MFSIETNRKHQENTCVPLEPMENNKTTQVFRGNLWKILENKCVPQEPVENTSKTQVFRGHLQKTLGKHKCSVGTYRTNYENLGFPWEPVEN